MKYVFGAILALLISYSQGNEGVILLVHTLLSWLYVCIQILIKFGIIIT